MPPRAPLTSSFSVNDHRDEVVCPLRNQDNSACRKRCLGEKRYRSMQEHIRRAHPEYYLAKLPATKESFELMISTPPHERPEIDPNHANHHHARQAQQQAAQQQQQLQQQQQQQAHHADPAGLSPAFGLDVGLSSSFQGYHAFDQHDGGYYTAGDTEADAIYQSMQAQQRSSDEYRRGSLIPAASAAAALAQLHYHRPDSDWGGNDMGQVIFPSLQLSPTITEADFLQNYYADQSQDLKTNHFHVDPALEDPSFLHDHHATFPISSPTDQPALLPSSLARSPPHRPTTLPPLQRSLSRQYSRPRKTSLSQQARMAKHERRKSKELAKRHSGDRKAFSAEPGPATAYGKRWEDLIDAAASATEEEDSRDLTPIPASPYQSPHVASRTSLPPFALGSQFQSFQASPLNRALTPPPADGSLDLEPFSSVDTVDSSLSSHHHQNSAGSSGSQFHIMNPSALTTSSDTSPLFDATNPVASNSSTHQQRSGPIQIYCAGCKTLSMLQDSFACTHCICGLCMACVQAIMNGQSRGRMSMCPRCHAMDSSFKPFQLDLR